MLIICSCPVAASGLWFVTRREASRGEAIARRGGADTFANMNRKPSTPVPVIECLARSVPVPFESASLLTDA